MGLTVSTEALADLVKHLPMKLRVGLRVEVLAAALQEGMVNIAEDGHWEWTLESKTLLAHFCGRMWCGDSIVFNKRNHTWKWQLGKREFPGKDLDELFGVRGLRDLRRHRDFCAPPCGFELIEKLFLYKFDQS